MILAALLAVASQTPPAAPARAMNDSRDRTEAYYHFSLGLQARLTGDTETSLAEYRKAQKLDAGSSAIRVETAKLLRESGRVDEAVTEAKEAVRLDKDNAEAHLLLAELYQMRAEGNAAEEALRK